MTALDVMIKIMMDMGRAALEVQTATIPTQACLLIAQPIRALRLNPARSIPYNRAVRVTSAFRLVNVTMRIR